MVPSDLAKRLEDSDKTSCFPDKSVFVHSHSTAATRADAAECRVLGVGSKARPRLHEPFVSPEFAEAAGKSTHACRSSDGSPSATSISWVVQPNTLPIQQAPLYTVRTSTLPDSAGVLTLPPPSGSPDALVLGKRLSLTATSSTSVSSSVHDKPGSRKLAPCSGGMLKARAREQQERRFFPEKIRTNDSNSTENATRQIERERASTSQRNVALPTDLLHFVERAVCTWGADIRSILGPPVRPYAGDGTGDGVVQNLRRAPAVATTGMFPQSIRLRFSRPVKVTSVRLRVNSVHRVVVHPTGGLFGDRHSDGKALVVPSTDGKSSWLGRSKRGQDIAVDVRGVDSFESILNVSVTITAGDAAFCIIHRLDVLGVCVQ